LTSRHRYWRDCLGERVACFDQPAGRSVRQLLEAFTARTGRPWVWGYDGLGTITSPGSVMSCCMRVRPQNTALPSDQNSNQGSRKRTAVGSDHVSHQHTTSCSNGPRLAQGRGDASCENWLSALALPTVRSRKTTVSRRIEHQASAWPSAPAAEAGVHTRFGTLGDTGGYGIYWLSRFRRHPVSSRPRFIQLVCLESEAEAAISNGPGLPKLPIWEMPTSIPGRAGALSGFTWPAAKPNHQLPGMRIVRYSSPS
jgi:hypothetical protein